MNESDNHELHETGLARIVWALFIAAAMFILAGRLIGASVPPIPSTMLFNVDRKHVCTPGYTAKVRHVTEATKKKICANRKDCVVDHVIPLELGGSNDVSNLAAQTKAEAHEKDLLEDSLHKQVCGERRPGGGPLDLDVAQHMIWMEWGHREGRW